MDRHESGIAKIVFFAVWPEAHSRVAEQLGDAQPHVFWPFDREVGQPLVEPRATRWPLLQALKRGLSARLTLEVGEAEDIGHGRDVM